MESNKRRGHDYVSDITDAAGQMVSISDDLALAVLESDRAMIPDLMAVTASLRERVFGRKVSLCSIINARNGACSEDCRFCAQSSRYPGSVKPYGLMSGEAILSASEPIVKSGVERIGVVTSGDTLNDGEVESICRVLEADGARHPRWCVSLGRVSSENLERLKSAGLGRYHHNLETARSFFNNVCTTHGYEHRLETVRAIRAAGLEVCSGGIMGMGETNAQRVELARALRDEQVDAIPLNFLMPIPGTPLENVKPMSPLDIIRCIVMFRLVNPTAELRICAGRIHLGDLQSWIFNAGANGMMLGDLLTTAGRDVESDLKMLSDLEMGHD